VRGHRAIGLQAKPGPLMAVAQMAGGRPEPGADLEDVALEVGAEQRRDVVLPVLRPREEL